MRRQPSIDGGANMGRGRRAGSALAEPGHDAPPGAERLHAGDLLLEDRARERVEDQVGAAEAQPRVAAVRVGDRADAASASKPLGVVVGAAQGGQLRQRPVGARAPRGAARHAGRVSRSASVAMPSGVRLARQMTGPSTTMVGSSAPRRWNNTVRRRSSGCLGRYSVSGAAAVGRGSRTLARPRSAARGRRARARWSCPHPTRAPPTSARRLPTRRRGRATRWRRACVPTRRRAGGAYERGAVRSGRARGCRGRSGSMTSAWRSKR